MSREELFLRCDGRWLDIVVGLCPNQDLAAASQRLRESTAGGASSSPVRDGLPFAVELIMTVHGWTAEQAIRAIEDFPDRAEDSVARSTLAEVPQNDALTSPRQPRSQLSALWDEAVGVDHPVAEPLRGYFKAWDFSGLDLQALNIRFHPGLRCDEHSGRADTKTVPAILAPFTDGDDDLVGLYCVDLTPGGDLEHVRAPERVLIAQEVDTLAGAAVKLYPAEQTMGVTYDLVNAAAIHWGSGMPVWVVPSAQLRAQMVLPSFVRHFFDWQAVAEEPRPGSNAHRTVRAVDERLVTRLCAEGVDAYVVTPLIDGFQTSRLARRDDRKIEWIDAYRGHGRAGFPPLTWLLRPLPTAYQLTREERAR